MRSISRLMAMLPALLLPLAAGAQEAQWPARPLKMIVPYAAGGASDVVARSISQGLAAALGQPVVVENRPGAAGIIGVNAVAKAPPDGYTVLVTVGSPVTSHLYTYSKLPYDPRTDLVAVSHVAWTPLVLVASGALQVSKLSDFVALAKAKPGTLSYGTSGQASAPHLAGELFAKIASVKLLAIPYKGQALATQDLIGNQISSAFSDVGSIKPFIQTGKVKALAVAAPERLQALPEVPTFGEQGMKPMDGLVGWTGVMVPAGTPASIVTRLAREVSKVVRLPEVSAQFVGLGLEPTGTLEAEAATLLRDSQARWERIMKDLGPIKAD